MKEAREYIGPQRKVHTVLACTEITESKPVRLETSCTKILPPPGRGFCDFRFSTSIGEFSGQHGCLLLR